jgi:hypothetical protein
LSTPKCRTNLKSAHSAVTPREAIFFNKAEPPRAPPQQAVHAERRTSSKSAHSAVTPKEAIFFNKAEPLRAPPIGLQLSRTATGPTTASCPHDELEKRTQRCHPKRGQFFNKAEPLRAPPINCPRISAERTYQRCTKAARLRRAI